MAERNRFLFERSKLQAGLKDVELETDLSQEELAVIKRVRELEANPLFAYAWSSGSTRIREYKTTYSVPFGHSLTQPRAQIVDRFRRSRDFLSTNLPVIQKETPGCVTIVTEIIQCLDQLAG